MWGSLTVPERLSRAISENPRQIVHIHGAARDVFIGERCLSELPEDPGDGAVALMERIRRIQYIEREGFAVQRPMGPPASVGVLLSLWTPQKAQAFEATESVGLSAPSGSLTVPISELPGLVGNRFHWLDEKQFAMDATPEAELSALYDRAAAVAIDPYRKARGKRRWQFWR